MQIHEYTPSQFENLELHWKRLEKGSDMTAFQTYEWFKNVNKLYYQEKFNRLFRKWIYILVTDGEKPILIAPIRLQFIGKSYKYIIGTNRGAHLIGKDSYSDYLNFIYDDFNPDALKFIFSHLKKKHFINYVSLSNIIASTNSARYIKNHYQCRVINLNCVNLTLPDKFCDYESMLSKSTRQNIRTAINRLHKNNVKLSYEMIFEFNDELNESLSVMRNKRLNVKMKKISPGKFSFKKLVLKGYKIIENYFKANHDVLNNNTNPWCLVSKDGDKIASYFWGISNDDRSEFYVILAAVDAEYEWYSPGKVSMYLFIKSLYDSDRRNIKFIDFTRGGEQYKYDMGAKDRETYWILDFAI